VAWRRGLPVLQALDAAIPAIPLAQAFGRWGNYFNQELFGTPLKAPWALRVEPGFRPVKYRDFATFHPTFLYECVWDLTVVGILLWLSAKRTLRTGSIVLCYLVLYATGRFLLELIRTDTTFRLFGLSRNAYVSLAVMIGAGTWLYLRERGGHREAREPAMVAAGAGAAGAEAADGEAAASGRQQAGEPEAAAESEPADAESPAADAESPAADAEPEAAEEERAPAAEAAAEPEREGAEGDR
jgi:Prolipoprotein diacylglyceryl transferase